MKKTQVKSKRPAKTTKVSSKAKTSPTKTRRLGGASAANAVHSSAEDRIMRAYDSGMRDGAALAEAQAGLEKLKASQQGLDAARVELIALESGADIAAEVAAKHIPPPSDKEKEEKKKADNAQSEAGEEIDGALTRPVHSIETHGELALALEALGEWLVEVPAGSKEARWKKILRGKFTNQDRYSSIPSETKSALRYDLSDAAAADLIKTIASKLKSDTNNADRIPPILEILESRQGVVCDFLKRFYQRHCGNRGEILLRRQKTVEALAQRREPQRLVGKSKDQVSKTLENDLIWIRAQKRTP